MYIVRYVQYVISSKYYSVHHVMGETFILCGDTTLSIFTQNFTNQTYLV